jgi:hypothetical protein
MSDQTSQDQKEAKAKSKNSGEVKSSLEVEDLESKLKSERSDKTSSESDQNIPTSLLKTSQNASKKLAGQIPANPGSKEGEGVVKTKKSVLEPSGMSIEGGEEISRRGKKKVYVVGVVITVIVLSAVGGVFFLRVKQSQKNISKNDTAYPTLTQKQDGDNASQTGTEGEEGEDGGGNAGLVVTESLGLERSEISLEVLNGTDVTGLAGQTADSFKQLGYEIAEVGNAEDTVGNKLYVNPDFEGELGVLLEDVEEELSISSVSGTLSGSDAHARIILGD